MLRGKIKFALASAGFATLAVAIPSCASILGIEDLTPGTGGGGASTAGSGGSSKGGASGSSAGGSNGASGSSAGGSSGGSAGSGSSSGGSAGSGGSATGGAAGNLIDGGAGRGGSGGSVPLDAGDARPPLDAGDSGALVTVHGTVIDYWRHRVPNVAVYLGAATTMTDAMGQFTFSNVTPPYDIGLTVRVGVADTYLFKGLKRSDPTLQVKEGLIGNGSTGNTWKFQNFPAAPRTDAGAVPRYVGIAFGSPDTIWDGTFSDPDGTDLGASNIDYEGGASSTGTAHALLWELSTLDGATPTRFVGYDQKPLTIDEVTAKNVTFNMGAGAVVSDTISGTVSSVVPGPIQLDGYVRFDDGAPIPLVRVTGAGPNFQILMPKITGSSITVSALSGTTPTGPFSLVHLDGLTPGQTGVQLSVPAPVSPVSPPSGTTNVGANAMFQWSASPHVALFYLYCYEPAPGGTTRFFVVTEDFKAQLPVFGGPSGIPLPKMKDCSWSIEIHGTYATVDQATSPTGFLDSHAYDYYGTLWSLKRDNGAFSTSDSYYLTTAP